MRGPGILSVEAIHRERPAVDGAADEPGLQVERAAVAEPDDLARARGGQRSRRGRQEGVDGRREASDTRHHRHRRVHRRARPAAGGRRRRAADHAGQRQQILGLHPHAGGGAPQHDAALPRRRIGIRLRGDQDQELVEVDRPDRGEAVRDRAQVHHRPQPRGGRPRDVAAVVAQRRRVGQATGVKGQVEPVMAVDGDRDPERRS